MVNELYERDAEDSPGHVCPASLLLSSVVLIDG